MTPKDRIREFIADNFQYDIALLKDDTPLLESDIIDSTGVMELVFFIADEFGVEAEPGDLVPENFNTIDGMERFLQKNLAQAVV
ncbi:MAG: acyl carrier protein [Chloroflexi bacterium]|nr:acyl carrier protein [Chloroflexota bacterium]